MAEIKAPNQAAVSDEAQKDRTCFSCWLQAVATSWENEFFEPVCHKGTPFDCTISVLSGIVCLKEQEVHVSNNKNDQKKKKKVERTHYTWMPVWEQGMHAQITKCGLPGLQEVICSETTGSYLFFVPL